MSIVQMIHLETTSSPFSISFKQNNILLMTVRTSASPVRISAPTTCPSLRIFRASLCAVSSWLADQLGFDHIPSRLDPSKSRLNSQVTGTDSGELINQQFPLNKIMLQQRPLPHLRQRPHWLERKTDSRVVLLQRRNGHRGFPRRSRHQPAARRLSALQVDIRHRRARRIRRASLSRITDSAMGFSPSKAMRWI